MYAQDGAAAYKACYERVFDQVLSRLVFPQTGKN